MKYPGTTQLTALQNLEEIYKVQTFHNNLRQRLHIKHLLEFIYRLVLLYNTDVVNCYLSFPALTLSQCLAN